MLNGLIPSIFIVMFCIIDILIIGYMVIDVIVVKGLMSSGFIMIC
jgi:hypothetical protein